jgi:serine/threonine protein kinase
VRENAYVSRITEGERRESYTAYGEARSKDGLVPVQIGTIEPLRSRRSLKAAPNKDARAQDDHVLFVSFEKGKKPRFCSVNFVDGRLSVFPSGAAGELSFINEKFWNQIKKESLQPARFDDVEVEFAHTVYCLKSNQNAAPTNVGRLSDTFDLEFTDRCWYAAIPSIVYDWADGTLQEAISMGQLHEWEVREHFLLFERVLDGVSALHGVGMLHGDIRPANVMAVGATDNPSSYRLGDYGSFTRGAEDIASGGDSGEHSGHTLTGPGVGRQRVTPFYSPERRAGVERESADVAIVLNMLNRPAAGGKSKDDGEYFVRLGWRSKLIDVDSGKPRPGIVQAMRADRERLTKKDRALIIKSADALQPGDRLRLRDYIFTVIQAGQVDDDVVCRCQSGFANVLHDRLAVMSQRTVIDDETVVSLAQYTEFRQWSVATDLYSVGALCLYCLFCAGVPRSERAQGSDANDVKDKPASSAPASSAKASPEGDTRVGKLERAESDDRSPDARFSEMMVILENVQYFQAFWGELEKFRNELETYHEENPLSSPDDAAEHRTSEGNSLRTMAIETVNNIVQSAPNADVILQKFDLNVAHFLLFMHFVLSCLHRQTDVPNPKESRQLPFSLHRAQLPNRIPPRSKKRGDDYPAANALRRLRKLMGHGTQSGYLSHPMLARFRCRPEEIAKFDPRSDFLLGIENDKLRKEIAEQATKLQNLGSLISDWRTRSKSVLSMPADGFLSAPKKDASEKLLRFIADGSPPG